MAKSFTPAEWKHIKDRLQSDPQRYGLPKREYGSVILGSFNIRKLGSYRKRNTNTWRFLADVCRRFDLLAVQEIMDDLSGLQKLTSLLGPEFRLVVSDPTGVFPGERGMGERLGFIYRSNMVERTDVASDITYDRTKIIESIAKDYDTFTADVEPYARELAKYRAGKRRGKPAKPKPRTFLTFVRQPFCVSFRIAGHSLDGYEFMAVNAHLLWGDGGITERKLEFDALIDWIMNRFRKKRGPRLLPQFYSDGRSQSRL